MVTSLSFVRNKDSFHAYSKPICDLHLVQLSSYAYPGGKNKAKVAMQALSYSMLLYDVMKCRCIVRASNIISMGGGGGGGGVEGVEQPPSKVKRAKFSYRHKHHDKSVYPCCN